MNERDHCSCLVNVEYNFWENRKIASIVRIVEKEAISEAWVSMDEIGREQKTGDKKVVMMLPRKWKGREYRYREFSDWEDSRNRMPSTEVSPRVQNRKRKKLVIHMLAAFILISSHLITKLLSLPLPKLKA